MPALPFEIDVATSLAALIAALLPYYPKGTDTLATNWLGAHAAHVHCPAVPRLVR